MGKGNRTRNSQYQDTYAMSGTGAAKAKKQTGAKDRTATFVAVAIALLLALSIVLIAFADSGMRERNVVVVSSDNHEVTGTMLTYFENVAYTNMFSQYFNLYYSYYFSGDANSAYSMAQQAMSQYTLSDFFDNAVESVKELLVLCEAADKAGVKLGDEEFASIQETLDTLEGQYTENFGTGVKEKDIRRALELQALASKYYETYVDEQTESVTDDEISKYIEENKESFYKAHALKYSITLKAEDYAEDEAAFESAKALADTYIAKLEAATDADAFKTAVVEYIFARDLDATVAAKVSKDLMPDEATLKEKTDKILADLVATLVEGKEETEVMLKDGTLEKALATVADTLESTCAAALASLETEQAYLEASEDADEIALWLVSKDTAVNATKSKDTSGDSAYTRTVYMLTEALHLEDAETVNVGHILVEAGSTAKDEEVEAAKKKAEEILATFRAGEKTKEAFEKLAEEHTADSGVFYDNVQEGDMVDAFNDWIFSADRKEIGETDIVKTEYGFHVMYWNGKGENTSIVAAKNGIVSERYEAFLEEGTKSLALNEKYIAKHTAETEAETQA